MDKRELRKTIRNTGTILYLVLTDGEYKLYPDASTAYHASQQIGPAAIAFHVPIYSDSATELTVEGMKRQHNYRRKYSVK